MPTSTNYFKKETKDYIISKYPKESNILDVGAGVGTYANILKNDGYLNIDCVEVFDDYIKNYNLEKKYRKVIKGDITKLDINFNDYDLIIFGDVLEHIDEYDAKKLLEKITNSNVIVSVPFNSPQGEHFNNIYEIHLQEDLTFDNFFDRYVNFYPLCLRFDYGVFVKEPTYKIYIETGEKQIPQNYFETLNEKFSDFKLSNIADKPLPISKNNTTIVTGLWNMGRGEISDSFKRSYDNYLQKFSELLKTDICMYIFIDPSDEEFIWKHREKHNTVINKMSLDELKKWFNFTELTNKIRQEESWISQASWLRESPQGTIDSYNPMVMSKMFMLNNVTIWNPFHSEYFFWIDAGITNTVHYGYFTHDRVFDKLPKFIEKNKNFVFLSYPYEGGSEIHGFERKSIAKYCNTDYVKYVCRGGFFGGRKKEINEINGLYYHYLNSSLNEGYMGTEESIFTIVSHNHPNILSRFMVGQDGLIWKFFEDLKNNNFIESVVKNQNETISITNIGLYVITFNSPKQFETLINSMLEYDKNFIEVPKKFLLDNSSDLSTTPKYKELCDKYGFEHIKKDNLGICGGRQFVAEHAQSHDLDGYWWSEDDMFFQPKKGEVCKNGFARYVSDLFKKTLDIVQKEKFDFLKINFTEFYGDNSTQWSWYNVPQNVREQLFPEKTKLPEHGLDPNAPRTKFKNIKSYDGIPYATGEIYYCNWTHFITKEGNKKLFLETTWAHPFENTWMSYIYQETVKGNINPGILLMTPIEHDRFDHYSKDLRREN